MFASRYWYQYDSVVFGVPRFLGYIYLYKVTPYSLAANVWLNSSPYGAQYFPHPYILRKKMYKGCIYKVLGAPTQLGP